MDAVLRLLEAVMDGLPDGTLPRGSVDALLTLAHSQLSEALERDEVAK